MRKLLISILLAGAAASPALAARHNDDTDSQQTREERAQAREERHQAREQSRQERSNNAEPQQVARPDRADRQSQQFVREAPVQNFDARAARRDSAADARVQRFEQRQQVVEQVRDHRQLRQSTRATPNVMRTRVPVVSNVPRQGTQPPPPAQYRQTSVQPNWSTSWRHNSKYDWSNHRRHHRSLFHLGFYYDPFGWSYSPYQIGWRLWPSYYSSRYWINDPWQYRLPYAPPGTRWVRYYDDAYLVDTWSGEVVDVIYNFFW